MSSPHAPSRTPSRTRRLLGLGLLVASVLLVSACGSDDPAPELPAPSAGSTPTDEELLRGDDAQDAAAGSDDVALTSGREDVFSVLSPWNTTVTDLPLHPESDVLLERAGLRLGVNANGEPERVPVDEGVYVNTQAWTVPVVAQGEPTTIHCRQRQCGDGSADFELDVPAGVDPDPRYDGWYTVFDEDEGVAYDLWRARREDDGTISYQFLREWSLDGPGFNQPYVVSARGSGLPLFGGLIRAGELERCRINHALAISVPGPAAGNFVQPASATDGNGRPDSLPEGARLRLRSDFELAPPVDPRTGRPYPQTEQQQRNAACLVQALQTYGAIVVDRAAVPTLYFQRLDASRSGTYLAGYELQSIRLEDFGVVRFSPADRRPWPAEDADVDTGDLDVDQLTGGQS